MGKILDYIEKSGGGKYICYKTKKLSLDYNDSDTLAYEDKPVSQFKKAFLQKRTKHENKLFE